MTARVLLAVPLLVALLCVTGAQVRASSRGGIRATAASSESVVVSSSTAMLQPLPRYRDLPPRIGQSLVDQTGLLGELAQLELGALEPLPERRHVDRLTLLGDHGGDIIPWQVLIDAQEQQGLLVGVERRTQTGEPVLDLGALERRCLRSNLLGDRRDLVGREWLAAAAKSVVRRNRSRSATYQIVPGFSQAFPPIEEAAR